jgi:hypothetical protein
VKELPTEVTRFIFPFSIPQENRKELFTKEKGRATIFCLGELEKNAALERDIYDVFAKADLLKAKPMLESASRGLERLNAEG